MLQQVYTYIKHENRLSTGVHIKLEHRYEYKTSYVLNFLTSDENKWSET